MQSRGRQLEDWPASDPIYSYLLLFKMERIYKRDESKVLQEIYAIEKNFSSRALQVALEVINQL